MRSTVAIINWNSGDLLKVCIESVVAATSNIKILVIDNGPKDGSLDCVPDFAPDAQLIASTDNRGFAAAANKAFICSSTLYVVLFNPDIQILPGTIQFLEAFMDMH